MSVALDHQDHKGGEPVAWPNDALPLAVEMYTGSEWEDITDDVRAANGANIQISRGQPDESSSPEPGSIVATVTNKTGKYSPRNPASVLYGKIGRNTPLRVRVTESHVDVGDQIRGVGEVSEWPPRWDVSGQDATTTITAQGILRRLGQGASPLRSPFKSGVLGSPARAFVVDYWPMEDGNGATSFASALPGRGPLQITGDPPDAGANGIGPLLGSDRIPVLAATTVIAGSVAAYADSAPTDYGVRLILDVPASPAWTDNTPILWLYDSGTTGIDRFEIRYKSATGFLGIRALDATGAAISGETTSSVDVRDKQIYLGMALVDTGSATSVNAFYDYDDGTGALTQHAWNTGSIATSVLTNPTRVTIAPTGGLDDLAVGQLVVTTGFFQFDSGWFSGSEVEDGLVAYAGERSGHRAARLADERGVSFTGVYVDDEDESISMGAQAIPSALVDNLTETYLADSGLLFESRDELGLSFRTRRSLYNQSIACTLDYDEDGEIAPDLEPTDDDRYVRNRVTVTRRSGDTTGSSATYEDSTSRMGTGDPPDGVGVYEDSVGLNLDTDDVLLDHAAWRVHIGTWDEARYPVVRINMTALAAQGKTALIAAAASLDVGDRLRLTNLPVWTGADGGTVDLMCLGFRETFDYPNMWMVEINTVPYGPYFVFEVGDQVLGRLDTSGSALALGVDSDDTSLLVATDSGKAVWINSDDRPDDFPFAVTLGGETVKVTAIDGTTSPQTFSVERSVNGVSKSHLAGTDVRIARVAVA